jgi:hypothetical protein
MFGQDQPEEEIMTMASRPHILRMGRAVAALILGVTTLSGCAASRMTMRHGSMNTHTAMSESVFLELDSDLPPTVYVSETCTTGDSLAVLPTLQDRLVASGYTLVESPAQATYVFQINHLRLAESELSGDQSANDAVELAWMAGMGASVAAAALDLADVADEVLVVAGVLAFLLDAKTKHVALTLTTDVLLTERIAEGEADERRYHETQVVSAASKVNLSRSEALPHLIDGVSRSVAGLLPAADQPRYYR